MVWVKRFHKHLWEQDVNMPWRLFVGDREGSI